MEEASASQLASVQGRLADGVVSALACAEDPSALQAAGAHVVKARSRLCSRQERTDCLAEYVTQHLGDVRTIG